MSSTVTCHEIQFDEIGLSSTEFGNECSICFNELGDQSDECNLICKGCSSANQRAKVPNCQFVLLCVPK